jgi:tRNA (guanine37-N1)-methyltransferase|tara:strand:- start:7563 stop:8393 length:831 start_codon:yes stop_codon:yes gene_type:complete
MPNRLKDLLRKKLMKKELAITPSSFDIVGNILIFSDFPKELSNKEKIIGNVILKNYKQIKAVFKKTKKYSGKYRTPKLKLLAGLQNKEAIHKENNVRSKLNVEKVYFSSRLSEERKRIFQQVKNNESVLVMFSGCAVYPLTIAKNTKAKSIIGIEINPIAHKYALENLKLNKTNNIELLLGDVKKILPKINKKFSRIIMPLPKGAENFLNLALNKIKKNGNIHFYCFAEENKYDNITKIINKECKKKKKRCKILRITKCGQFSPRVYRTCVDFIIK